MCSLGKKEYLHSPFWPTRYWGYCGRFITDEKKTKAPPIERFFRLRCCWDRPANVMCKQCDANVKTAVEADNRLNWVVKAAFRLSCCNGRAGDLACDMYQHHIDKKVRGLGRHKGPITALITSNPESVYAVASAWLEWVKEMEAEALVKTKANAEAEQQGQGQGVRRPG
jgi:hypothetical protein